jgi:hypothetical protein
MKRGMNIAFVLLLLVLVGCGTPGSNFNKRKYTNLKSKQVYADKESSQDREEIAWTPTEDYEIESQFSDESIQEDFLDIEEKDVVFQEEQKETEFKSYRTEIIDHLGPKKLEELDWEPRRDYNNLSKQEQEQAMINFNWLFNSGLAIFFGSILLIVLFFLAAAAVNAAWPFILLWAGLTGIFSMWIISMVALNRVRKINRKDYSWRFQQKWILANIVAYIGVAACVVTILGGLVLLILYALHIICF